MRAVSASPTAPPFLHPRRPQSDARSPLLTSQLAPIVNGGDFIAWTLDPQSTCLPTTDFIRLADFNLEVNPRIALAGGPVLVCTYAHSSEFEGGKGKASLVTAYGATGSLKSDLSTLSPESERSVFGWGGGVFSVCSTSDGFGRWHVNASILFGSCGLSDVCSRVPRSLQLPSVGTTY